jgi:hypothetical protein
MGLDEVLFVGGAWLAATVLAGLAYVFAVAKWRRQKPQPKPQAQADREVLRRGAR